VMLVTTSVLVVVHHLSVDEVWKNMSVKIVWGNSKVPIEEIEKLFLHQVDFGKRE